MARSINVGHQNSNSLLRQSRNCCHFIKKDLLNFSKFNKRRAFNKAVGPGKNSKINKRRAYALIPNYRVFKIDRAKMCIASSSCAYLTLFTHAYSLLGFGSNIMKHKIYPTYQLTLYYTMD